jgi:hypothetical protein
MGEQLAQYTRAMEGSERSVKTAGFEESWQQLKQKYSAQIELGDLPESEAETARQWQGQARQILQMAEEDIQKIEQPDYQPEKNSEAISLSERDGRLFYQEKNDQEQDLTLGELLTDGDYGLRYDLDESVSLETKKKYLLSETERRVKSIHDRLILLQQINNPNIDGLKRDTYRRILSDLESGREPFGLKIEKQVKNFFKKMTIDRQAPFQVEDSDPLLDVEKKTDFILVLSPDLHGMKVEEGDLKSGVVDVQFTVNDSSEKQWYKKTQIGRLRDQLGPNSKETFSLITVDGRQFRFFNGRWEADKTPGGPDKAWHAGTKWELLFKALKNVMSQEEIDKLWQQQARAEKNN